MEAQRNRWEIQHNIKVCNHDNDNRFDGKTQNQPLARFNVYVYKANYDLTPMPRRVSTTLKKEKGKRHTTNLKNVLLHTRVNVLK